MTNRQFLSFQLFFWLLAALLLFLYGLQYGHWHVALIRNIYFPVVGFIGSIGLVLLYRDQAFLGLPYRWAVVLILSLIAALLTSLLLNPITYALLGDDITQRVGRMFSTGTVFFAIIYGAWSFIFLDLEEKAQQARAGGDTSLPEPTPSTYLQSLPVGSGNDLRTLDLEDLECVLASGDYVEFATRDRTYLKKASLASMSQRLDPKRFVRIHRSAIVNIAKVNGVRNLGRGSFEITLGAGRVVRSSRSYQEAVGAHLPKA